MAASQRRFVSKSQEIFLKANQNHTVDVTQNLRTLDLIFKAIEDELNRKL